MSARNIPKSRLPVVRIRYRFLAQRANQKDRHMSSRYIVLRTVVYNRTSTRTTTLTHPKRVQQLDFMLIVVRTNIRERTRHEGVGGRRHHRSNHLSSSNHPTSTLPPNNLYIIQWGTITDLILVELCTSCIERVLHLIHVISRQRCRWNLLGTSYKTNTCIERSFIRAT